MIRPKIRLRFFALPILLLLTAAGCSNTEEASTYETNLHTKEIQMEHKDTPTSAVLENELTTEAKAESEKQQYANDDNADTDTVSQANTSETNPEETETSEDKTKFINSSDEAVALLKDRLSITDDDDLIVDSLGGTLEKDVYGAYYTLVTKVKSWVENGGSGTADTYLVYEDGTIIDQSARNAPQETTNSKLVGSTDEAINLVIKQLDYYDDDFLIDSTGGDAEEDEYGTYYYVIVKSKSAMENGGTGSVGIYRVYEDGTIIDAYAEAAGR
ncbi:hypothetical protein [Terribacillus saccharophilus]|uniref:Uncharacterized protein n=1 Tax=Terribacillus saccharophilus TaxID=361277 RepID=A0ABX4GYM2_9BACI|nr:hypothetical protein [Terribacillus saccharophilus]PAD35737.1 hypothetical protein CHH56_07970 [Terribacillus saccharophilus]PAD96397.1 hypothetical protein CHH50_08585 [Terribacillus saccharophilus]PAD99972.1 hypothetical protein CHH48_09490 [Terribacillus saccharophilus]